MEPCEAPGSLHGDSSVVIRSVPLATTRSRASQDMEKRVLVAFFLSFLVLYAYQAFFLKPAPKPGSAATGAPVSTSAPTSSSSASSSTIPSATPPATGISAGSSSQSSNGAIAAPSPRAPAAAAIVGEQTERDIQVETANVIAVFTNRGARLKSWRLKHYFDSDHRPQELIEPDMSGRPLPFSLRTANDELTGALNGALYRVSEGDGGRDLHFEFRDTSGLAVTKEFHLDPSSYIVTFRWTVADHDASVPTQVDWGPAVGDFAEVSRYRQNAEALFDQAGKVQRLGPKDLAKQPVYSGEFRYVGVDDNYFMTAVLAPPTAKVVYQTVSIPSPNPKDAPRELVAYSLDLGRDGVPVKYFVGPKDFDVLAAIGPDMTRAINFGMFSAIVVPLLRSLKWVNGYVGNYGWSIVILTVIIQVVMFPLSHKSIVSMRKMQEIQPLAKAIQDRYAKYKTTDPEKQKMNQELMALYREKGVNPASGCVPMLLTLPVFYAMWAMLSTAIELRGAPFVGWIHDLTAHDPYYITPVLMGVTQIWQMKMTPSTGTDPAQQKMMMFVMPVMMTVMFFWMPAGALVYYVVSNILRIGQQYLTYSLIGPPNVRTVRPPAERRVKRVAGKADLRDRDTA